jgi:hypothetical protein
MTAMRCDDLLGWLISTVIWIPAAGLACYWLALLTIHPAYTSLPAAAPLWAQATFFALVQNPLAIPLLALFGYMGLLSVQILHWWLSAFRQPGGHHLAGLRSTQVALGNTILLAGAVYLAVSLVGLPARAKAGAEMDYWINHGEVRAAVYYGGNRE